MSGEKILVVDDEASLRTVLRTQLQSAGYEVSTASSGREGLERVTADHPDLILLDVMMPEMDGSEVCRRLKASFLTSHIPVIILTAKGQMEDKINGLGMGANDYLIKPHSQNELLVRVRNLLQWSRSQREANPLTGLPGNSAIEAELNRRIEGGDTFAFLYLDIDNFKAYNDHYNYQKGDEAIRLTASIILGAVGQFGRPTDFVGHVGGDDFVIICHPSYARELADELVREFDEKIQFLYTEADRLRGHVEVPNRQNVMIAVPLMSLTVAGMTNVERVVTHIGHLSDIASELKRFGKAIPGSTVVWERRGD